MAGNANQPSLREVVIGRESLGRCAGYMGLPFAKFVMFCERTSYVASTAVKSLTGQTEFSTIDGAVPLFASYLSSSDFRKALRPSRNI